MPIPVRCPSCDHQFRVPDKFAGKRGKCPKCKSIFLASAKAGERDSASAASDSADETAAAGGAKTVALPKPKMLSKDAGASGQAKQSKTKQPKRAEPLPVASSAGPPAKEAPPKAEAPALDADPLRAGAAVADPLGISTSTSASGSVYAHRPKKRSISPMAILGGTLVLLLLIGVGGVVAWSMLDDSFAQMAATGDSAEPDANDPAAAPAPPPPPSNNSAIGEGATNGGNVPTQGERSIQSWDIVRKAIVTVTVIDRAGETHVGRGVIVDPRGWVATSFTLIAEATDAHITLADDRKFEASGTLAKAPTGNLALLKIDDPSEEFPALMVNNRWLPGAHEIVFVGDKRQPLSATIEGVADWRSIPAGSRARLPEAMRSGDGVRLLAHSQRIDDELNGAPLLIVNGDVVGINIALGPTKEGYAVTASDIADMLADVAPNRIEQFAKANPLPPIDPSIPPIDPAEAGPSPFPLFEALVDRLAEIHWKPTTAQQYHDFQALAANVTEMQKLADASGDDLPADHAVKRSQLERTINAALNRLTQAAWPNAEEMARVNQLAISTISAGDPMAKETGVYLFGKCVMRPEDFGVRDVDNLPGFAFEVVGTLEVIVMGIGKNGGEIAHGEHCLILGSLALDETYKLTMAEGAEPREARIVRAKYLLRFVKPE